MDTNVTGLKMQLCFTKLPFYRFSIIISAILWYYPDFSLSELIMINYNYQFTDFYLFYLQLHLCYIIDAITFLPFLSTLLSQNNNSYFEHN